MCGIRMGLPLSLLVFSLSLTASAAAAPARAEAAAAEQAGPPEVARDFVLRYPFQIV